MVLNEYIAKTKEPSCKKFQPFNHKRPASKKQNCLREQTPFLPPPRIVANLIPNWHGSDIRLLVALLYHSNMAILRNFSSQMELRCDKEWEA